VRIVAACFFEHVEKGRLLPSRRSAYRAYHLTETAVIAVHDIVRKIDSGQVRALVLLDLSAACDTAGHVVRNICHCTWPALHPSPGVRWRSPPKLTIFEQYGVYFGAKFHIFIEFCSIRLTSGEARDFRMVEGYSLFCLC